MAYLKTLLINLETIYDASDSLFSLFAVSPRWPCPDFGPACYAPFAPGAHACCTYLFE